MWNHFSKTCINISLLQRWGDYCRQLVLGSGSKDAQLFAMYWTFSYHKQLSPSHLSYECPIRLITLHKNTSITFLVILVLRSFYKKLHKNAPVTTGGGHNRGRIKIFHQNYWIINSPCVAAYLTPMYSTQIWQNLKSK